jgi:hypothetical protein
MVRKASKLLFATLLAMSWSSILLADEPAEGIAPPEIVLDAKPAAQKRVKQQAVETETFTIYESKVFPGFRPCTTEDYRNRDSDPVACQDDDISRRISTRDPDRQSKDLIVDDNVVPQGNIYKLRFERFKKKK